MLRTLLERPATVVLSRYCMACCRSIHHYHDQSQSDAAPISSLVTDDLKSREARCSAACIIYIVSARMNYTLTQKPLVIHPNTTLAKTQEVASSDTPCRAQSENYHHTETPGMHVLITAYRPRHV